MLYNNLSDTYINEKLKFIPNFECVSKDELKDIPIDNKNGNYIIVNTLRRDDNDLNGH